MTFACYDLTSGGRDSEDDSQTHIGRMDWAARLGFATAAGLASKAGVHAGLLTATSDERVAVFTQAADVRAAIEQIEQRRPSLGFEIDGAVIKANRDDARARLGDGSRTPNWAVAYKYAAQEATSVIEDIEVGVGRTGRISLRARIARHSWAAPRSRTRPCTTRPGSPRRASGSGRRWSSSEPGT